MTNNTVYLYTNFNSPRLSYILNELFKRRLGLHVITILHLSQYQNSAPLLVYGNLPCFLPHIKLLNWNFLHKYNLETIPNNFTLHSNYKNLDVLTASFLQLSRYEEYLPSPLNKYGSYNPNNAQLAKYNLLQLPIVDIWINDLANDLKILFPRVQYKYPITNITLTYDIDIAFAYKGRSFARTLGAMVKDVLHLNFKAIKERIQVLKNKAKDPFDNFEKIFEASKYFNKCMLFFPAGKNNSRNRHLPITSKAIASLLKNIPTNITIGLHPTYNKKQSIKTLNTEKLNIALAAKKPINSSRQHYLYTQMPLTFTNLINVGILNDYTLGYNEINGFRAGTCNSFYFFNVLTNEATYLVLNPLIVMDAVYIYNQNKTVEEALQETIKLYELCKKNNGNFIINFHNNYLQPSHPWHSYYVQTLQYLSKTEYKF